MRRLAILVAAIMLLSTACDIETDGSGRGSGFNAFRGGGKRVTARQHRMEARRTRERLQRRLAMEQRREARLAEQRRERREQRRREQEALAAAAPAPEPANCTDGYDPCLVPAADYDCEGGSGDGPAYTGYVTVTGYDTYELDADGDGVGCES